MTLLPPKLPCDCGRATVLRVDDDLPRCYACQAEDRKIAQSWMTEPPTPSHMELIIRRAFNPPRENSSISCAEIRAAFEADHVLKTARTRQRYDEYRAANPLIDKQELTNNG